MLSGGRLVGRPQSSRVEPFALPPLVLTQEHRAQFGESVQGVSEGARITARSSIVSIRSCVGGA